MKSKICANVITMICTLNGKINVARTFEMLPISIFKDSEGKQIVFYGENEEGKKVRVKIPFLGKNELIVSCRSTEKSRGIRQGGKQLQNVVGVDFQLHNKNYNMKISSSKIQLTGALSESSGLEALEYICNYILEVQNILSFILTLTPEEKDNCIRTILDHFYPDDSIPVNLSPFPLTKQQIGYFNMIRDIPKVPSTLRSSQIYFTRTEFEEKLRDIFEDPILVKGDLRITDFRVANSFFTHKLNTPKIPLMLLFEHLKDKFDKVSFNHTYNSNIQVTIPCEHTSSLHRFVIFVTGTVKQTSPTFYPEAYKMYRRVFSKIEECLEQIFTEE